MFTRIKRARSPFGNISELQRNTNFISRRVEGRADWMPPAAYNLLLLMAHDAASARLGIEHDTCDESGSLEGHVNRPQAAEECKRAERRAGHAARGMGLATTTKRGQVSRIPYDEYLNSLEILRGEVTPRWSHTRTPRGGRCSNPP